MKQVLNCPARLEPPARFQLLVVQAGSWLQLRHLCGPGVQKHNPGHGCHDLLLFCILVAIGRNIKLLFMEFFLKKVLNGLARPEPLARCQLLVAQDGPWLQFRHLCGPGVQKHNQ